MLKTISQQRGVVLVIGLIFLLILTLISISGMNSSSVTEKMTANFRNNSSAFEAAESALGSGELWIQNQTSIPNTTVTCGSPPCAVWVDNSFTTSFLVQQTDTWWQTNAMPYPSNIGGVSLQPYYIIQQAQFVPYALSPDAESQGQGYYFYLITARGTGANNSAHSVVQSIFVTQYN